MKITGTSNYLLIKSKKFMFTNSNHKSLKMKNIFSITFLILLSIQIKAQEIIAFNPVIVDENDIETYEKNNKEYMVKLAQDAVDRKEISGWVLLKKMHGELFPDNNVNYILVSGFESINQLLNRPEWWKNSEEKFGIPIELLSNNDMQWKEIELYNTKNQIVSSKKGKFVILNWASPNNMNKMIQIQSKVESHFKKKMDEHGMAGWGFATTIAPQGKNSSETLFWDVYDSFENVLLHLNNQAVLEDLPNELSNEFGKIVPNGWDSRVIFQIIASTK